MKCVSHRNYEVKNHGSELLVFYKSTEGSSTDVKWEKQVQEGNLHRGTIPKKCKTNNGFWEHTQKITIKKAGRDCSVTHFCLLIRREGLVLEGHGLWRVLVRLNSRAGYWLHSRYFTNLVSGYFLTIMCDAEKPYKKTKATLYVWW